MINQTEKTVTFLEAINLEAKKRCSKIKQEVDKYVSSELQKARIQAHEEVKALKKSEYDKLTEQNNASLSENEATETKLLIVRRSEIADSVFSGVEEKLNRYTESADYLQFLIASISNLKEHIGNNSVIFLRPQDKKYESELSSLCNEIRYDESIRLGGCRAENAEKHLAADDTFETRLEEEKQNFYKNSGLSITL